MKRNIRDDFEYIYLRFNTVKRDIAKADQSVLQEKEFQKTVRFAAGKSFSSNHGLYESNGFSFDDILSITTLFGLAFMGNTAGQVFPTNKDRNNLMIHYINQRLNKLCEWIVKKFSVDEAIVHSIEGAGERFQARGDGNMNIDVMDLFPQLPNNSLGIKVDGINMYGQEEDDLPPLMDRIENHEELLENTKKALKEVSDGRTSQLRNRKKRVETELRQMRSAKKREATASRILTRELKNKLTENPQKYSDLLAYYATTKHVSKEIRKAARAYCKKYAIDYVSWVRGKIEADQIDRTEFTF